MTISEKKSLEASVISLMQLFDPFLEEAILIDRGVCLTSYLGQTVNVMMFNVRIYLSIHFRLVDGTLEKICGEFIDHEKSVFLLALHGSNPAIGGYD